MLLVDYILFVFFFYGISHRGFIFYWLFFFSFYNMFIFSLDIFVRVSQAERGTRYGFFPAWGAAFGRW